MKKFKLLLVSLVLMAFGATGVYAEDYAATHTSNVTFTLGNKSYKEKMNIAGTSYDVVKLGTSSVVGTASFKIPAGTAKIHMHVIGWSGKSSQVNLTADNGVTLGTTAITPQSDAGAANNSPYTLKGDATTYYYEITTTGVEQETTITMTSVSGKTRVIVWGVNTEVATVVDPETPEYTITANVNDPAMGIVSGAGKYYEGTVASLNAIPNPGYKFVNWSNGSTDNPLKITVTENVEITANFEVIPTMTCAEASAAASGATVVLNPFDVVYVVKGAGYIYIKDESGVALIYDFNLDDQLKAGDHVEGFVGTSSPYNGLPEIKPTVSFADLKVTPGTAPEATVFETVPTKEDVNKYVVFKGVKLTSNISYTTASATNATISVGGKNATLRNAFKLAASLTSGSTYDIYAFVAIYNGNIQMYYASSVDVSPERTITATVNPAETGTVTGAGTYKEGKTATLTATPAEGYAFTCWTEGEDTVSTAANYSFKVAADRALVANFAKKTYNVTVTAENGTVEGAGEYEEGKEATLTATAAEGYEFTCWTSGEDTVSTANPYTFAVTANLALVANFNKKAEPEHTYTVAGSSATVFGTAWDPANADNDMKKQEDGTYKLEKTELTLAAGTIEFKVCQDHAWTVAYPGDNYKLTIAEDGIYTITITFNPADQAVAATATKTGDAGKIIPVIAMHGNFLGSWADTEDFTLAADEATATLTLTIAEGNYEFGVRIDGTWTSNGVAFTRENASAEIVAGSGNLKLAADVAGEYTFTWTFETNTLTVTYPVAVTIITETFDLIQEEDTRNMGGTYSIYAGDYTLRIFGYEGAGTYQDDTTTVEDAAPMLFTPDYDDALNPVVVVTIDEENNKEVMQVTATSADGTKIYNLTINIALPSYEKYSLIATGIQAENDEVEGMPVIRLKGEGYLGEETVPFSFMVYESMMGYGAEGTIGEINVFSTKAEFFAEEGAFTFMATMQDDEGKYLFNVEVMGTMPKAEVEIVVKETKDVTLYNLNLDVQGNMAMVTADNMTLSFNLTLLDTENYYGTYTNDAFSNIWYGDDQLYAAYGEAQVYAEVDGKAKFVVSFISTPDAEGNVTLYNFTLYAGEKTATGVENLDTTIAPVKMLRDGQLVIMKGDTKYNAQGAKL